MDVSPAWLYESVHTSGMVLQVILHLLQTNHCPLRRWTWHLKLNTVQFSAYLITRCSTFLEIWWHAPVTAYVSAVMLQHKLQWEFSVTVFPYTLCSYQHSRTSLSFVFSAFHLSFMKMNPSSFFCSGCYLTKASGLVAVTVAREGIV